MAQRGVLLTAAGMERLQDELTNLRDHRLPELAARILDETESGNVTDNSEYEDLKESRIMVEARIQELEQTLARASVIERDPANEVIGLGSKVHLRCDDGVEESWVLVDPREASAARGAVSTGSPAGQAVLGRRKGETTCFNTPGGSLTCTILSVE